MVRIVCEWDIGQEDVVFSSREKARAWLDTNPSALSILDGENLKTLDDVFDEGLLGYYHVEVNPE